MSKQPIYLDHAASTFVAEPVLAEMVEALKQSQGNPSSIHRQGRKTKVMLEASRRRVAEMMHASTSEIVFTSGGTEANNAVFWCCYKDLGIKTFISSPLEHPSVIRSLENLKRYFGVMVIFVRVDREGHPDLSHLEELLDQHDHALVSLMHANNEIGTLLPAKDVSALCHKAGALFHSDTVQTIGKYHMDFSSGLFDFAVASGHKFHGPQGVGFLYVRPGLQIKPFIDGGSQERGLRAGTENLAGVVGLSAALAYCYADLDASQRHIAGLKDHLIASLKEAFPSVVFNGDITSGSAYSILNFSLPIPVDTAILLSRLDMEGICVSSGSACSSGSVKGSHVLTALGVSDDMPSLRVSFSRENTRGDVDKLVQVLKAVVKESQHHSSF